jgi:hypothetical protein
VFHLPWESRVLLWLASRTAPAEARPRFIEHWRSQLEHHALLLSERGIGGEFARPRLRDHAVRALRAGMSERWGESDAYGVLVRVSRSGSFAIATAMLVFLAGLTVSRGFEAWRIAGRPLPVADHDRLVTLEPNQSAFSRRLLLTPRQLLQIRREAASFLTPVEGFSVRWTRNGWKEREGSWTSIGLASKGLFPLLGLSYLPGAVLGAEFARERPELLGRRITLWDNSYLVTGVLPDGIRLAAQRPHIWIPMSERELRRSRFPTVLIARLGPGITHQQAAAEFDRIAPAHHPMFEQHVRPLQHGSRALLSPVMWLLGALVAGLTLTGLIRGMRNGFFRYEAFFVVRTALLLGGIAAVLIEMLNRQANLNWIFLAAWAGCVATVVTLYGSWRDHSVRCRSCLSRMTKPVRIGSHASPLLEGVGAEWICENGHGALWMEGVEVQAFGPTMWRAA